MESLASPQLDCLEVPGMLDAHGDFPARASLGSQASLER